MNDNDCEVCGTPNGAPKQGHILCPLHYLVMAGLWGVWADIHPLKGNEKWDELPTPAAKEYQNACVDAMKQIGSPIREETLLEYRLRAQSLLNTYLEAIE